MRAAVVVALAGVRHRPVGWLLLTLGVLLAAALPVFTEGMRTVTTVSTVQRTVAALPDSSRTVIGVTSTTLDADTRRAADTAVVAGLTDAGLRDPLRATAFRLLSVAGTDVAVAAVAPLEPVVALTGGRLPHSCGPSACEALLVVPPGATAPPSAVTAGARRLGVVVTGQAVLRDTRLLDSGLLTRSAPLLLAADPVAVGGLDALQGFGRTGAWLASLDGAVVARDGVDALSARLAALVDAVDRTDAGPLILSWPSAALQGAQAAALTSGQQYGVLGTGAAVLQLGFCAVVAIGVRRRSRFVQRVLRDRGARPAAAVTASLVPPLLAVVLGTVLGLLAGGGAVALRLRGLVPDPPAGALVAASTALPAALGVGVAALVVVTLLTALPDGAGRPTRWVLDTLTVLLAAGVVLVATDDALAAAAAPALALGAAVLTGLVAARAAPLLARIGSGGAGAGRWARRAAGRRPLAPAAVAGFLAAGCATGVFALAFAGGVSASAADRAAEQVPLAVRVSASSQVAVPGAVVDAAALRAADPSVTVVPVVASPVAAAAGTPGALSTTLVGIDAAALPQLDRFATTTGLSTSADRLADLLLQGAPAADPDGAGGALAAGTTGISVTAAGADDDLTVVVWVRSTAGAQQGIPLTRSGSTLSARLPAGSDRVDAVEIAESAAHLMHRQHGIGEGSTDREVLSGTLTLSAARLTGSGATLPWTGWHAAAATGGTGGSTGEDGSLRAPYRLADERVLFVPPGTPSPATATLPVVVDPQTAARAVDGVLPLTIGGSRVRATVVAVAPRWPTLSGPFAVADRGRLTALVAAADPGTLPAVQVWLGTSGDPAVLVRVLQAGAAGAATLTVQRTVEQQLRSDPVSTGVLTVLLVAAALAVALCWVAVAVTVRGDGEASTPERLALELDGVPPGGLRRVLVARTVPSALVGGLLGTGAGVLTALVTVPVLVSSTPVVPPVRAVLPPELWWAALAVLVVVLPVALLAAAGVVRRPGWLHTEGDLR